VSGELKPKPSLIRFVCGPEGQLVPDLAEKLPGRGMWVSADAASLSQAVLKNLFSKSAKKKIKINEDVPRQVAALLVRRVCDLLGLAKTAGAVVARESKVLDALREDVLDVVLVAHGAGQDISKKLCGTIERMEQQPSLFMGLLSREEMAHALGREICVVVGLRSHPLTEILKKELSRLAGVGSPTNGSCD
jgi:predicted RNA-binding protein YlxR (DUF448 family)